MARVALIFPPTTDPRGPHLGVPSLAAFLRDAGIETRLFDLDIGSLLAVLRPANLRRAAEIVRRRSATAANADRKDLKRLATIADTLPANIDGALATLRDRVYFFDPNHRSTAREQLLDAMDLISAATEPEIHYSVETMRYDVEGVDPSRLADLIRVTAMPGVNPFAEHWNSEVIPGLLRGSFDLVGVSICNKQQVIPGLTLARQLRSAGCFVVIGGPFFTKFTNRLAQLPEFFGHFANAVVVNEGETAMVELLNQIEGRKDFGRVPNLMYLDGRVVKVTNRHDEDLTTLPTPDFGGLPLDDYLSPERVLPILAGKGCYHGRCKFCDIPFPHPAGAKAYRMRPVDMIASDILTLHERFGARHFLFTDESMAPGLLRRIARALRPYDRLNLRFAAYSRFESGFDAPLFEQLAGMGVRRMFFGLESGCQKTLDHMNKGIRLSTVRPILEGCAAAGISFHVFSMIGLPEETAADAAMTLRFFDENADIMDNPCNTFDVHPFELQMQAQYGEEPERFGLAVPEELLGGEFLVGVGREWTNTRGIDASEVDLLLSSFINFVHKRYRHHAWPACHWPALEEWGLLYADRYFKTRFPFRLTCPEPNELRRYRWRWNPAVATVRRRAKCYIVSRNGGVELDSSVYEALADPNCAGFALFQHADLVRTLLRLNMLQLEPLTGSGVNDRIVPGEQVPEQRVSWA